jgi:aarF domain-containing kinase
MASLRISTLPQSLRLSVFSSPTPPRHASTWARRTAFSSFFHRTPIPRSSLRKNLLWFLPLAGGISIYLLPEPQSILPNLSSSPTLIPCSRPRVEEFPILSPAEPHRSILSQILALLRDRIWEPIRTATRFLHLFIIFIPVIVTSPMLLYGKPESRYQGDRWGAVWWYGMLTRAMESAGPTFIKVCFELLLHILLAQKEI